MAGSSVDQEDAGDGRVGVKKMSKYTSGEVQQVIDDLDFAQAFFSDANYFESKQVLRSLKNASDILTELPHEVIETLDKKRDVFEPVK